MSEDERMSESTSGWLLTTRGLLTDVSFSMVCVGVSILILGTGYLEAFLFVNAALVGVLAAAFFISRRKIEPDGADIHDPHPTATQYLIATFVDVMAGLLIIALADSVPAINSWLAPDLLVFQLGLLYLISRNSVFRSVGFLLFRIKAVQDGSLSKRLALVMSNLVIYIPVFVFWLSREGYGWVEQMIALVLAALFAVDVVVLLVTKKRALHRLFGILVVKELRLPKRL